MTPTEFESNINLGASYLTVFLKAAYTNVVGTYTFAIKVTAKGGKVFWSTIDDSNYRFSWTVACGPTSTTITYGSFPTGYQQKQLV